MMSTANTFLDWDAIRAQSGDVDPSEIDSSTAYALNHLTEEQVTAYHDAALRLIAGLKETVDPTGVGQARGIFGYLDSTVNRIEEEYTVESDRVKRAIYADYLSYVYEYAREAYRNTNPVVDALASAKDAAINAGKGIINTGENFLIGGAIGTALLIFGAGYLLIRLVDGGLGKNIRIG